ncbi:MAG: Gfo/Idh/MocA family protein [Pirellulales bacterium]
MNDKGPRVESQGSRRHFLKESAAVTVGASLSLAARAAGPVHVAGDERLRIGLVGCGGRGAGAAANAMQADKNTRLVAMGDAFPEPVERSVKVLKKKFPDRVAVDPERRFSGFVAYRQVVSADVDVVILATPPHFRPVHLGACVKAGKHVFVEKPVAVDAPGVRSVLAACQEAQQKGLSIVSGLCYRFNPGVRETMRRVHDGAIGEIVAVQETYNCGPPWFRNKDRQAEWTEMEYQMRNWYPFTWLSGDHIVEQHVHSLDKGAWAIGQIPHRAWGSGGRQVSSGNVIGQIFDHHAVVFEYASGVRMNSHCRRLAGCANDVSDIFMGTKGICNLMKGRIEGENPWRYRGPKGNMYVSEHEALFRSIRDGSPLNHGEYMAHSTMLGVMGRMVTYTGRALSWEEALNSKETLAPAHYAWETDPPVLPDADGRYPVAIPGLTKFV